MSKTIAFVMRWSFFNEFMRSSMIKGNHSQFVITTLILCLCMGSLVALPLGNITGFSGLDVNGIGHEKDNLAEQAEFEDEFMMKPAGVISILFWYLILRPMTPDFHTFYLTLVSPPPKHT